jgi:glucosamine-6-phosphate deaminase
MAIDRRLLYEWCRIPVEELASHPGLRVPLRLVSDSAEMGELMARELVAAIRAAGSRGLRAIIPCGPSCWYRPFTDLVNAEAVSLRDLEVFHMDECLDWQARELPRDHPYSFRGFMERHFYGPVESTPASRSRSETGDGWPPETSKPSGPRSPSGRSI